MDAMRTTKSKRWAIPLILIVLVAGGLGLSKTWSETRADDQARAQGTLDSERPTVNIRNVAEVHGKIIMGAAPEWATIMGAGDAVAGEGHNAWLSDYSPAALHQATMISEVSYPSRNIIA